MKPRRLCVYCGSSEGVDPAHAAAASELGQTMASAGVGLVYGGGAIGLMGVLAAAVIDAGGEVTGIIPRFLREREGVVGDVTELIVTADMHERKSMMFARSDGFVALPGGIGTLEETVEMMTWAQLGRHAKPVILANIKGFWDPLASLLRHMAAQGFVGSDILPGGSRPLYASVDTIADVLPAAERLIGDAGAAEGIAEEMKVM